MWATSRPRSWLLPTIFAAAAIALCAGAEPAARRRPNLGGLAAKGAGGSSNEESLGSQLLNAVLSNDLEGAAAIFAGVSASQAVRLSNAIDWRGKSVLMHAASRNHAEMAKLLIEQKARVDAADYTGGATALMLAARPPVEETTRVRQLQAELAALREELRGKDEEREKAVRSLRQEHNRVKAGLENRVRVAEGLPAKGAVPGGGGRVKELERQVCTLSFQLTNAPMTVS